MNEQEIYNEFRQQFYQATLHALLEASGSVMFREQQRAMQMACITDGVFVAMLTICFLSAPGREDKIMETLHRSLDRARDVAENYIDVAELRSLAKDAMR